MASRDFFEWLGTAEIHWFFIQAEEALQSEFCLPGTIGLINGIEASIRFTLHQLDGRAIDDDLGPTLSNSLIRTARERGLPVHMLAWPGEADFDAKLATKRPYVEVVRLRHNLAHGNIVEFINREHQFFTPECLRESSDTLLVVARGWARELGAFSPKPLHVRQWPAYPGAAADVTRGHRRPPSSALGGLSLRAA